MWRDRQSAGTGVCCKRTETIFRSKPYARKGSCFCWEIGIDKVYDQIDDVFSDDEVDIIYISTPHNTHISYLRKALRAGKHVLCEKSITLNAEELEEAVVSLKNIM